MSKESMTIELDNGKLWVEYEVIPPAEDEEYTDHEVLSVRLDSAEGADISWLYAEFEDLQGVINDRITTELN